PSRTDEPRGLLLLLAPSAGVSELLRQTYDALFNQRREIIPVYFSFTRNETTAVSAAIEFLNTFLQQYVAYSRDEPALCQASLTLTDLVQLALPNDHEWIQRLVDSYNQQRFGKDDKALVRFCLSVPQRVPARSGRPFVMLDGMQLAEELNGSVSLGKEVLRTFTRGNLPFAFAGLRRQILNAALAARCDFEELDILRLESLSFEEARLLAQQVAHRQQVATTEGSRDLLVQQFECSPFFISAFFHAARDRNTSLTTYLNCEQLYVDELMGGRLHRYFASLLEEVAPAPDTRRSLIRFLYEAAVGEDRRTSLETWRRQLQIEFGELESILRGLHEQELINWDGSFVEAAGGSRVWKDYLKVRYRLEVLDEQRALVVADTISDALKRAPQTMARHYRSSAALSLQDLLLRFNGQRVQEVYFYYDRFSENYKGASPAEISSQLESETELIRLPQVVHVAGGTAFDFSLQEVSDPERCVVARAFEGSNYNDASEVVWLVAEVESKLEADAELSRVWCDRLEELGRKCGFGRVQTWLIAPEGFTDDAAKLLNRRGVFYSSRQQVELLSARISEAVAPEPTQVEDSNEFMMVLPMGEDTELIAASTAEQIARRLSFRPEAINQIKTAVVEACINAAEHSFSPDRKIYQRFRVENDRLVVTISSRGVVPPNSGIISSEHGPQLGTNNAANERRGWGLRLIKTLMDEVEFESVDEGTSLKMTKYLRQSSS
ncbi:MAG TPA: ATP-binding protein, partial [Pyrinomonadaceae bacterium]|nr:ATP-binding protein [Pyrinomonadaceae bacterium]